MSETKDMLAEANEQRTEPWGHAAHAYYDGWQQQLASLREEVELMKSVLAAKNERIKYLEDLLDVVCCARSDLTPTHVREMRNLYAQGQSQRALAKRYNTTRSNVQQIVQRKTWRHIT